MCNLASVTGPVTRWMSWHQEPMKDVGACDKPGGGQPGVDSRISEWGNPAVMDGRRRLNA